MKKFLSLIVAEGCVWLIFKDMPSGNLFPLVIAVIVWIIWLIASINNHSKSYGGY